MATEIRPELSEKNPYWIGKHRYYELKHFCLQYPIWKKAYNALLGLSSRPSDLDIFCQEWPSTERSNCKVCGISCILCQTDGTGRASCHWYGR